MCTEVTTHYSIQGAAHYYQECNKWPLFTYNTDMNSNIKQINNYLYILLSDFCL